MPVGPPQDVGPLFTAAIDLIGRLGAKGFQIRYDEEQEPIVWVAVVELSGERFEAAAALTPERAAYRLCERLVDGGKCVHCRRPTAVEEDWRADLPMAEHVCWYIFDPELKKFRRSCEGEAQARTPGRNDLCPCASGRKWKHCHGS